jgi:hypothetical protein
MRASSAWLPDKVSTLHDIKRTRVKKHVNAQERVCVHDLQIAMMFLSRMWCICMFLNCVFLAQIDMPACDPRTFIKYGCTHMHGQMAKQNKLGIAHLGTMASISGIRALEAVVTDFNPSSHVFFSSSWPDIATITSEAAKKNAQHAQERSGGPMNKKVGLFSRQF